MYLILLIKCQRFGHVTGKCKHSETCARCSETGHKDDICTKKYKCINCGENMHHTTKSAGIIRWNLIFNISEYQKMCLFSMLVQFIKKNHGKRVMNYAGATKAPSQCTSVHRPMCRGLGLSLLHGSNVLLLLLLLLAGQFHLSHDSIQRRQDRYQIIILWEII